MTGGGGAIFRICAERLSEQVYKPAVFSLFTKNLESREGWVGLMPTPPGAGGLRFATIQCHLDVDGPFLVTKAYKLRYVGGRGGLFWASHGVTGR